MRTPSIFLLWSCLALFLCRVLGQVEALLVAPSWLPTMAGWYSGLLPYPVLLPVQILLLMVMTAIAWDRSFGRGLTQIVRPRSRTWLRGIAIVYFIGMATRLAAQGLRFGPELYLHGAIPVAFHWVLALFLLTLADQPRVRA
jgi:hypothetical protein